MFSFDLPFLFICGLFLSILTEKHHISQKINWFLGISLLFTFQAVGIMLWLDIIPGSKEFMIIPFNIFGLSPNDFEPLLSSVLFALEPLMIVLGELIGLKLAVARDIN